MKQGGPKVWNCFTLECILVDEKLSNAVRPYYSGQLLLTSIAIFIAYGHNYVVITSFHYIIEFKIMLQARYVTVFIMHSAIMFWWFESTPLKEIVWFVEIMLTFKNQLLKAPLLAWYFWVFTPNVSEYCSNAYFDSMVLFSVVLSLKCT